MGEVDEKGWDCARDCRLEQREAAIAKRKEVPNETRLGNIGKAIPGYPSGC